MILAAALAALLVAPSPVAAETQPGSATRYPHDPAAIVRLECRNADGNGGAVGTAVKVGPNAYITAAHVVDGRQCFIGFFPVRVTQSGWAAKEKLDYAVFVGPASDIYIPISCDGFKLGKAYLARGYAFGGYALNAEPWIALRIPWDSMEMLAGNAYPGMSGGAVLDRHGDNVGVINTRNPTMSLPFSKTPLCR